MQRPAIMVLVMSISAPACALVEPAPPLGTVPTQARVKNLENFPVELAVKTPTGGVLPGAVAPASLPANGIAKVTFYLPVSGDWWITVNGSDMFPAADIRQASRGGCAGLDMEVTANGAGSLSGCASTEP